ncbi:T9SS type A sorting domain-containing protein [Gilvibacter sediminis]|uniref:T9SS type A sorting domain-containing protein n=1 Tax=Gilvibacter sediminis TaxID=379071 RepID=UPI00234FCAC6|nr:T9SS type A sorting domain-containing protein [Gilvibacter sediminis]MDC7996640.1 T9SS type A sorting domain-containing protein [Gilvibacter sediminis]
MKKLYAVIALFVCGLTYGQIVNPTSATTTFNPDFGTDLTRTYDGTGLFSFPSVTSEHDDTSPTNSFVALEVAGTIDFDLGGTFDIDGIAFWNQNAGGPSTDVGVNGVTFYSSTDGVTYVEIPGAPTAFNEVFTAPAPPEVRVFPAVTASFIRMEVTSNHGGTGSGFAEIAFAAGVLSVQDFELNAGIQAYPNPANNVISLAGLSEAKEFVIYNVLGAQVKSGVANNNQPIQIDELTPGMYFLKIDSGNTVKFIKQ